MIKIGKIGGEMVIQKGFWSPPLILMKMVYSTHSFKFGMPKTNKIRIKILAMTSVCRVVHCVLVMNQGQLLAPFQPLTFCKIKYYQTVQTLQTI